MRWFLSLSVTKTEQQLQMYSKLLNQYVDTAWGDLSINPPNRFGILVKKDPAAMFASS
jgi:hypothetical protein